jgi:hypothetical protein
MFYAVLRSVKRLLSVSVLLPNQEINGFTFGSRGPVISSQEQI